MYDFYPIKYWTFSHLQKFKARNRDTLPFSARYRLVDCCGCTFSAICTNPKPCIVSRYFPYLPRHVLLAVNRLGIIPAHATQKNITAPLKILTVDGKHLAFSIFLFVDGREVLQTLLIILSRHPQFSNQFTAYQSETLHRYALQPLAPAPLLSLLDANNSPLQGTNWSRKPAELSRQTNLNATDSPPKLSRQPATPKAENFPETLTARLNARQGKFYNWAENILDDNF